jgi:outer membrane protein TolC
MNGATADPEAIEAPPSVVPAASSELPIDLDSAMRLAASANPTIAIANEAIRLSQSEQLQARALLLPTLAAGLNYHEHDGTLQSSSGIIRDLDSRAFFVGAGAAAFATTTIPGVRIYAHLGDAIFEPLAARQRVANRTYNASATCNSVMLDVAERYLALAAAEQRLAAAKLSDREFAEVARLTANFAKAGQGRTSDAERAQSESLLLRDEIDRQQEAVAVASADLVQILSLDPTVRLHSAGGGLSPIVLVSSDCSLDSLLKFARTNRPEVAAAWAAIEEARTRVRQEKVRPFLPLISVGVSSGDYGGGSNLAGYSFDHFAGRTDFDVLAVWNVQNLGIGNLARVRTSRAVVGEAIAEQQRILDRVSREVAEAFALIQAWRIEMESVLRQLDTASESFKLDLMRARNIEGRPIELLNSARLLEASRQEAIQAVVEFNLAQFRLYVAIGYGCPNSTVVSEPTRQYDDTKPQTAPVPH